MDNETKAVGISINAIRQTYFNVNESLHSPEGKEVRVRLDGKMSFIVERNLFNFALRASYHYKEDTGELAATEVENIFRIEDLDRFINENKEANLPAQLWVTIVALSVSHTRALLARSLAGTVYQGVLISIINAQETAKQLFPKLFEAEE